MANKPAAAKFDFSTLAESVTVAEVPEGTRARKVDVNPFSDILATSFEQFEGRQEGSPGRQVVVPAANGAEVVSLIRNAADDLKIGARVVCKHNGQTVNPDKNMKNLGGKVTILFQAKQRRAPKGHRTDANGNYVKVSDAADTTNTETADAPATA